jgi:hypothetical protein
MLFTLPPSPVLQSIVLPLNYSFCLSSSTPSRLHLSLPSSPNLSPHYPSLLHTHHLLISLLYQLHTTSAPCKSRHKHPPLQQTCTKHTQGPQNPATSITLNPPNHSFPLPFLVPPLPSPHNL